MSIPWHQREPNLAAGLRDELEKKYPDLHLSIQGDQGFLQGTFPIIHDGVELDRFHVDIRIPPEFPEEMPVVFETAGRVPRMVDWHTFVNGNLCVIVPEEWFLNPKSKSLMAYLDGPLRNFFIGHALTEAGQPRPMGERSHSVKGLLESYGEMVESNDPNAIIRYLDYCSAKKLRPHWPCPCGSGKKVTVCHLGHVVALRKRIPRWIAKSAYERLRKAIAASAVKPTDSPATAGATQNYDPKGQIK